MGEFATEVQSYLCDRLEELYPDQNWDTEHHIAGTPVDIAGIGEEKRTLVELEWRRADPADNSAKLFRHLSIGSIDADHVDVVQVFTAYYDLANGGVSSKRENAEFVGEIAAETIEQFSYYPIDFDLIPPKRGDEWPDDWRQTADDTIKQMQQLPIGTER